MTIHDELGMSCITQRHYLGGPIYDQGHWRDGFKEITTLIHLLYETGSAKAFKLP